MRYDTKRKRSEVFSSLVGQSPVLSGGLITNDRKKETERERQREREKGKLLAFLSLSHFAKSRSCVLLCVSSGVEWIGLEAFGDDLDHVAGA